VKLANFQKYLVPALFGFALLSMGTNCAMNRQLKDTPPPQPKPTTQDPYTNNPTSNPKDDNWEPIVAIMTTEGEIRVKLYNETPLHRDNFLKLIENRHYDSLLFHRVITGFVIQGGDPDSKYAKDGKMLGDGDVGYTVPPEFNPKFFHKRGALAAARESDLINPGQESSGCQFYIVQGKVWTDSLLKTQGKRVVKNKTYNKVVNRPENKWMVNKFVKFDKEKSDSAMWYAKEIDRLVEKELPSAPPHQFTPEQVKAYTSIGGTPHLDGSYTVFGEVIQGMEIVDKIASSPRDKNDRPLSNIRILRMIVLKRI
jgi:peptidylprolyl isomerase